MQVDDLHGFVAYRNDPAIARYQSWELPYTMDAATQLLADATDLDRQVEGEGINLAIELDGEMLGDAFAQIRPGGGVAEIGYTLAPEHHGRGYATEAAGALVDSLFEHTDVQRVEATLDPDNAASMRVLEAIGMEFECIARGAFCLRGAWVDDLRYAMTKNDRAAWLTRPRTAPDHVELVVIEPDIAHLFGRMRTHYSQQRFVSPMPLSFRDALFPEAVGGAPVVPWMRGVVADGERVGFVMCSDITETHTDPFLWRLLIDRMHQRRGIGERVVAAVISHFHGRSPRLMTSYGQGPGSPEPFYRKLGFVPTGEIDDGEVVAAFSIR